MTDAITERIIPQETPETREFWAGARRGELVMQRCVPCQRPYFYPRPTCPDCGSDDVHWEPMSGRAQLCSYVISHRPAPGYTPPYVIALVTLEEGPRMLTNLVGVDPTPDNLALDMPLRVRFEWRGETAVPVFVPAGEVR